MTGRCCSGCGSSRWTESDNQGRSCPRTLHRRSRYQACTLTLKSIVEGRHTRNSRAIPGDVDLRIDAFETLIDQGEVELGVAGSRSASGPGRSLRPDQQDGSVLQRGDSIFEPLRPADLASTSGGQSWRRTGCSTSGVCRCDGSAVCVPTPSLTLRQAPCANDNLLIRTSETSPVAYHLPFSFLL